MLDEASEVWGVGRRAAAALFLVPIVGSVLVAASRVEIAVFRFLTAEDSVLEWLQFLGFLAASVGAAVVAARLARRGEQLLAVLFALLALGTFFIAGEEIAWGQRVLGIETPPALAEVNKQGEITAHNIGWTLTVLKAVMALAGLYGSIVVVALARVRQRRGPLWLIVPPLFTTSAFAVVLAYQAIRFVFFPEPAFTVTEYGEWSELCMALGLATFVALTVRRVQGLGPRSQAGAASRN